MSKKLSATSFFRSITEREGGAAWQKMGGTPALAELGIVDESVLKTTLVAALDGKPDPRAFLLWSSLSLEAWVRPRLSP